MWRWSQVKKDLDQNMYLYIAIWRQINQFIKTPKPHSTTKQAIERKPSHHTTLCVSRCHYKKCVKWFIITTIVLSIAIYLWIKLDPMAYQGILHAKENCFPAQHKRANLIYMINTITEELKRHNLTYWLTDGTLLGAHNFQGLLPWDYDGDIAIPYNENKAFLTVMPDALKKHAFQFEIKSHSEYLYNVLYKGNHVDFFTFAPYNDIKHIFKSQLTYYTPGHMAQIYEPSDFWATNFAHCYRSMISDVLPLTNCTFEGKTHKCPKNTKTYLQNYYCFTFWTHLKIPYKIDCYIKPWNLWKVMFG